MLVSLRAWSEAWQRVRVTLEVRADSVASLTLCMRLKTSGHGPTTVARELALCLGDAEFRPDVVGTHIPGAANISADVLSRRWQPEKSWALPALLQDVPETIVARRDRSWWRTLAPPPRQTGAKEGVARVLNAGRVDSWVALGSGVARRPLGLSLPLMRTVCRAVPNRVRAFGPEGSGRRVARRLRGALSSRTVCRAVPNRARAFGPEGSCRRVARRLRGALSFPPPPPGHRRGHGLLSPGRTCRRL